MKIIKEIGLALALLAVPTTVLVANPKFDPHNRARWIRNDAESASYIASAIVHSAHGRGKTSATEAHYSDYAKGLAEILDKLTPEEQDLIFYGSEGFVQPAETSKPGNRK